MQTLYLRHVLHVYVHPRQLFINVTFAYIYIYLCKLYINHTFAYMYIHPCKPYIYTYVTLCINVCPFAPILYQHHVLHTCMSISMPTLYQLHVLHTCMPIHANLYQRHLCKHVISTSRFANIFHVLHYTCMTNNAHFISTPRFAFMYVHLCKLDLSTSRLAYLYFNPYQFFMYVHTLALYQPHVLHACMSIRLYQRPVLHTCMPIRANFILSSSFACIFVLPCQLYNQPRVLHAYMTIRADCISTSHFVYIYVHPCLLHINVAFCIHVYPSVSTLYRCHVLHKCMSIPATFIST